MSADGGARFWSKVDRSGDCWLWQASLSHNGYARFQIGRRGSVYAHRKAYEMLVGPIPEGMTLDHLCRVRHCVNPAHLEPVLGRINTLRGQGPTAQNARKTHCPRGHEYTPENTAICRGRRTCRTCHRLKCRRRRLAAAQ